MKVLVGLSGGVDSSVAALLLKKQGFDVAGVTMAIWRERNTKASDKPLKDACYGPNEKEDIEEAQKISKQLEIKHHVIDCRDKYEEIVLKNFRDEYLSGRTPNPCIWCNSLVKFGALPFIAKESGISFDKFATGHYARVEFNEQTRRFMLKTAIDPKKDQTYFLYRLKQEQLANIIMPLGGFTKSEIREIAKEGNLHVFDKDDSQDFYSGDYNELLEIQETEGNIVDKSGKVIGKHNGFWNYTIGQRKGLGVSADKPLYVIDLNKDKNEVIVGPEDDTFKRSFTASDLNWISIEKPQTKMDIKAKIRSSQQPQVATIQVIDENTIRVEFENPQKAITPGQSVVFYDNDIVLGGGIINRD